MLNQQLAGHSHHLLNQVDTFLEGVAANIPKMTSSKLQFSRPVAELEKLLFDEPIIRMYTLEMLGQVSEKNKVVKSIPDLLYALQIISTDAPLYSADPLKANFFPVSTLFAYMMMTPAGQAIFRMNPFNDCIKKILKDWCVYLDSQKSRHVLNTTDNGWLCSSSYQRHNLSEYLIPNQSEPHWGFSSFNAFFHRQIKPEFRPIAEPKDSKIVTCPNDGTLYKIATEIKEIDHYWIKGQPYSLHDMLTGDELANNFVGGMIFQSFLDGKNYHRFRSPIAGTIHKILTIEGLMFSNAEAVGEDLTAGTYSQAYMSSVNTRKLVFIKSHDIKIGMICLIAIGISEVSSISIYKNVGELVEKGEELGHFSYGGSSVCLIFEPDVLKEFTIDINDVGTEVGTRGVPLKAGQSLMVAR